jgi:PBP1b-binding outer membrane lipoprotein LpoB
MTRWLAVVLIALLVAGCSPVAYQAKQDEPMNTGHVDSGGGGGGSM